MTEQSEPRSNKELAAWIKQQLGSAVHELIDQGVFESVTVEAKPAWVFPFSLLIGRIREDRRSASFYWFICGDGPITHIHSSIAPTPRDAARHFALQWHLDAARKGEEGGALAAKAAALYELVEEHTLWQQGIPGSEQGSG